uniref:Coenzyme PQQ synthesis protein F-like C-terminal lobe domain-containing protein n=1 Tax=Brassica campestris TaxID=3711 RepID=M4ERW7_BRACM
MPHYKFFSTSAPGGSETSRIYSSRIPAAAAAALLHESLSQYDDDDGEEEEDSDGSYEGDDGEGDDMDEDEVKEKGEQQTKKQLLCKRIYDSDEKLSVLNDLSLTDLNSFIPVVRSQIFIEALCHGNLSEDEAVNISRIFKNSLTTEPLPVKSRHREQITCFPLSAKLVRDVNVKNKSETNSVVELYYQIEPEEAQSTKMKAMLDLFHEIIEEPLFNQLRTKEQLGYVVECGPRFTYRVHGFCFCVQSSKYGPVHLFGRIDNFIKDIEGLLIRLSRRAKKHREKKDVISWYKTYFRESSPKCRRLAVREWRCDTNMKETQTDLKSVQQVIADAVAFKSTSQFYPSLCY